MTGTVRDAAIARLHALEATSPDPSVDEYADAALAPLLTRLETLQAALAELVRLKDGPRDEGYRAGKDAAWEAARTAVADHDGTPPPHDAFPGAGLAEALARTLGEFHNNPEWTRPVGSVGLDDEAAFAAAQGRWEAQEEERQAQVEAVAWALEQPAVRAALPARPVRGEDSETLRRVIDSAFGTDAVHGLIAQRLVAAGWVGPRTLAAEIEAATVRELGEAASEIERELVCCDAFERKDSGHRHQICYWAGAAAALVRDRAAGTPGR